MENGLIEDVFPIENGDIPYHSYVSLPDCNDELHTVRKEAFGGAIFGPPLPSNQWGDASRDAGRDAGEDHASVLPASSIPWSMDHPRWKGHE